MREDKTKIIEILKMIKVLLFQNQQSRHSPYSTLFLYTGRTKCSKYNLVKLFLQLTSLTENFNVCKFSKTDLSMFFCFFLSYYLLEPIESSSMKQLVVTELSVVCGRDETLKTPCEESQQLVSEY